MQESIALTESTYYILLALYEPAHGYGIMQKVERMSNGRVSLAAGTLYGALNNLCDRGWIGPLPSIEGSRKKEYKITKTGIKVLKKEVERLNELVTNGYLVLGE